jgi:hypothetical protein
MDRPSFEQLIKEGPRRARLQGLARTFLEYLDLGPRRSQPSRSSHTPASSTTSCGPARRTSTDRRPAIKRLYKDETFKVYNFFRDEFFGIEKTVAQIVRYFHSASLKGEESRQVLYLMGPVGLRQELARRAAAARARGVGGLLLDRRLPDVRGAAAPDPASTSGKSSRRCSACTSRATSARCAASA